VETPSVKDIQTMDLSNLNETLNNIEDYKKSQQEAIRLGTCLEVLMKDQNFKDVILNGYVEVRTDELFKTLMDYNSEELPEDVWKEINSIKGLTHYLETIRINKANAPENIHRNDLERIRVTAESAIIEE